MTSRLVRFRQFLPLFFLLLVPPAPAALAQTGGVGASPRTANAGQSSFRVDRGPIDHLGRGSHEDLLVDLGAGGSVSVFSGNLLFQARSLVRGDAVPDSQMALTYNHLDAEGSPSLAVGWSYDLGRRWVSGAWGDRVLIDADGFQDSFLSGSPPTRRELLKLADDLVREWRRRTPLADRRASGGESTFRQMISSDPLFFGEMRLRYLGPPKQPAQAIYRSQRRGTRSLQLDQSLGLVVLSRHDGGRELYSKQGQLQQVEAAHGPAVKLVREGRHLASVEVGGVSQYYLDHDSYGRMTRIRSTDGSSAELQYADRYLHRIKLPEGSVEMSYDNQGRLVRVEAPDGTVEVSYDERSGRVATASGPLGDLKLGDLAKQGDRLEVAVSGSASGSWTCSWSESRRERRLSSAAGSYLSRYEPDRPLPIEMSSPRGRMFFEWSEDGRLLSVRRGAEQVRWQRSDGGLLGAVQDIGGSEVQMVRGEGGALIGWLDPAGRRTRLSLDAFLLPEKIEAARGALVQVRRSRGGLLRQVEAAGHGSLTLRRDSRGMVRTLNSSGGSSATLQRDHLGRVTDFESSGGLKLELSYGVDGRLVQFSDGYSSSSLGYRSDGNLVRWNGAWGPVSIERDDEGRVAGLSRGGRSRWTLRRGSSAQILGAVLADGVERELKFDGDGVPSSWQHSGGGRVELQRDEQGRVAAWTDELLGDAALSLDRWGRVSEVQRGSGLWQLARDASGRATSMRDPVGAESRFTLDASGRVQVLAAPEQLTWRLKYDGLGRLTELRDGNLIWTLRYGPSGLPEIFADSRGHELRVEWDSAGRWRSVLDGATEVLQAAYGALGPTRVGEFRRSYGEYGQLLSWGEGHSKRRWRLERGAAGMVSAVVLEDLQAGSRVTELANRQLVRDGSGRILRIGAWSLDWQVGGLAKVSDQDSGAVLAQAERDSIGRVKRFSNGSGHSALILRDALGDVRELNLRQPDGKGLSWRLVRDSSARVVGVTQPGQAAWRILRDPLGRVRRWQLEGVAEPFLVEFLPLDGTFSGSDRTLAASLGIEEADRGSSSKAPGSRRVRVELPGALEVLRFDEVRGSRGTLQAVTDVWETTLGSWEPDSAGGDDPIGVQLDSDSVSSHAADLIWGEAPLVLEGQPLFPSVDGSGAGLSGAGQLRLHSGDGVTISWLGSGATLDGFQVPIRDGEPVSPAGWGSPELLWERGVATGGETHGNLRGSAQGVRHWWRLLDFPTQGLARLPDGVAAASRAWRRPRQELFARAALLPAGQPVAGPGAGLPPVPGSSRLVPGPADSLLVSPLVALVLSGDLPPQAAEHEAWLPMPAEAWSLEVPGAAVLQSLAERRAWPSVPAAWQRGELSGASAHLAGFVTAEGRRRAAAPAYELRPAVSGLPAGVADVLPGRTAPSPLGSASLPVHGRAGAVESLSDDPFSPGAGLRAQVESDSLLLFLRSVASAPPLPQLVLAPDQSAESWNIDLPSGLRLVVDRRGRLLSVDALGRLHQAWGARAVATLGDSLLSRGNASAFVDETREPSWLPSSAGLPEARWGIVGGRAYLALDARLIPTSLRAAIGSIPYATLDAESESSPGD